MSVVEGPPVSGRLACHRCDWSGALDLRQYCPRCGATLRVAYPRERPAWEPGRRGVWRYRSWLPIPDTAEPVTLGEGATPLLDLDLDGDDDVRLLLKAETANPTLSFKDRPVAVAATAARALGARGLLCASTGNTAVAVAAYAARAGLPALCLVPEGTPPAKLALAGAAGAHVLEVRGTYSDAHALAAELARRNGWANLTSTYLNPYMLEGDKTLALELVEQLDGRAPDAIVVPVGAGPLLAGIAQGLDELRAAGRIGDHPTRLHAVQAAGCAPIARAFDEGAPVRPWGQAPLTAAGSIADPLDGYPADGQRTLDAVTATGGAVVAADDAELVEAAASLARATGLIAELGAAAALAGYRRLHATGRIEPGSTVVLVLTGHGAKDSGLRAGDGQVLGTVAAGDVDGAARAAEGAIASTT